MTDLLFGTVSTPLWPAVPAPAYSQTQPLASGLPFGATAPGRSADPNTYGRAFGGANFATGMSALASRPLVSGMPLMGVESPIGVTAPALLTAVALRRGQPLGPTNDQEVEEVIYDAFELLPGTNDVDVRVEGGRAVLSGSVSHKRLKRDLGELAWAIPALNDVQNNVTITARRRARANREADTAPTTVRKSA
jgi:hypothetical protein